MRITLSVLFLMFVSFLAHADVNMEAIRMIESSGGKYLVGDNGKSLGPYQIQKSVVDDYNKAHDTHIFHKDCMREDIGLWVSNWYMNVKIPKMLAYYGLKDTVENRLFAYNAGIGSVKKGIMPKKTKDYLRKYEKHNV